MNEKILKWFATGRVGASSKTMACAVIGSQSDESYPLDPADFNRCLLLLEAVPEVREHFDKIAKVSDTWKTLIDNWKKLEKMFLDEVGLDWTHGTSAPKTYDFMQELFNKAEEKEVR